MSGYATLGFPGGPGIKFRIDPQSIEWGFKVNTSVTPTVGGRVVQVTGATLSDITIQGLFGQDTTKDGEEGLSYRLAQNFGRRIRLLMDHQSQDVKIHRKMQQTAVFTYAPNGWRFRVYLKDYRDPDGGALTQKPEKFSYGYVLGLFVVQNDSDTLTKAGQANGVLNTAKAKAINSYISRISDGMGWKPSIYNGDFQDYYSGTFPDATSDDGLSGSGGLGAPKPKPSNPTGQVNPNAGNPTVIKPSAGTTVKTNQPVI